MEVFGRGNSMPNRSILLALILIVGGAPQVGAQVTTDDIQQKLKPAYDSLKAGHYQDAIKVFRSVNKSQKNTCAECYAGAALACFRAGQLKDAIQEADRALAMTADASVRLHAREIKAEAFRSQGSAADLQRSEEEFRTAIREFPDTSVLHMGLGITLLKEKRDAEGIAEMNTVIALTSNPTTVERARKYIENPRRARENFAPTFTLKTSQGQDISLDKLAGKIVVLDFWATWCPACRSGLSELKELVAKYPEDRLCLISVSVDEDGAKWQDFVGVHKMVWPQYRDTDHKITTLFAVRAFPTYIVIDGDGVIQQRLVGTNPLESVAHRLRQILAALPRLQ
jgi:thiol-disulfide isomerase/thioredoxin